MNYNKNTLAFWRAKNPAQRARAIPRLHLITCGALWSELSGHEKQIVENARMAIEINKN